MLQPRPAPASAGPAVGTPVKTTRWGPAGPGDRKGRTTHAGELSHALRANHCAMSKRLHPASCFRNAGVTLIELAITIALVGILAALIVQFVAPVRSYIDSSRRAALADTADTALRRLGRDLRLALPNSVRVTTSGGIVYLEFLLLRVGGPYR